MVNWHYIFTIGVIACGSIPKGYDEGGFSSATGLPSFKSDFGLNASDWGDDTVGLANRKANISSFGVLGAAIGSILVAATCDRLGRLRTWQLSMIWWMTGNLLQTFSSGVLGLMLFARIWGGLGAGGLTVVTPMYLSEIAPARSRGAVTSVYMVVLLTFLSIGFFISYGAGEGLPDTRLQYRLVVAIVLVPTGIALLLSFSLNDTPKWLAAEDRVEDAVSVLSKLRGGNDDDEVALEIQELQQSMREKQKALDGVTSWQIIKEIATIRTFRMRLLFGIAVQTIAQWSGGNGITYYIPTIFEYAGVKGSNTSLITSGAYGIVKLVFVMIFTWLLVDNVGRRKCSLGGLFLQFIAHVYLAVYMALFMSGTNKHASDAAIAAVFVYAVGWSVGLCTIPFVYSTEIYPTRIRGVCVSINMVLHWFFQFAVVRVTPNLFAALDVWGAYVFWASICFVGLIVLGLWAPETMGVHMDQIEDLFEGPWYTTWKAKPRRELQPKLYEH
ncbi:general substrate transporter [Xylariaceae sp. FL1272]|nr:general substrate transporter [Xylariaceae sp. FL1272]